MWGSRAGESFLRCWISPADGKVKPKHPFVPAVVTEEGYSPRQSLLTRTGIFCPVLEMSQHLRFPGTHKPSPLHHLAGSSFLSKCLLNQQCQGSKLFLAYQNLLNSPFRLLLGTATSMAGAGNFGEGSVCSLNELGPSWVLPLALNPGQLKLLQPGRCIWSSQTLSKGPKLWLCVKPSRTKLFLCFSGAGDDISGRAGGL